MPAYRKRNNPIRVTKLTPEEMRALLDASKADEAKRGRGPDYHTKGYSVPLNRKHRPYR